MPNTQICGIAYLFAVFKSWSSHIMPREHERTSYLTEVILESASGKRQARLSDLSLGGCFVDTLTNVREGEDVTLSASFENGDRFEARGRVAYVMQGFGFGLSFIELTNGSQEILEKLVKQ